MDAVTTESGETLDHLAGDWRLFQLKRGHRFSTDDLMTAWRAAASVPAGGGPLRQLDLGAGIGSVGLLALWRLLQRGVDARLTMVEVQPISHALARKSVRWNGLQERVSARLGDLREALGPVDAGAFDLVTGSPPYLPLGQAVASKHPQKAAARFELHGDVFDYCRAAAFALAPGGRFVFCHASRDPRPEQAVAAAGLTLCQRTDVIFRSPGQSEEPLIALFTCAPAATRSGEAVRDVFVVRGPDGRWTDEYLAMRADMGTTVWNP